MVARILADGRYTGEKGYPKLIDEEQLIAATEKRSATGPLPQKTEAQKVLRRLCGTPPSERVEQSVTDLLNGSHITRNAYSISAVLRQPHIPKRRRRWIMLWNSSQSTRTTPRALILRLAAEQYAALGNEEYETNRLRRLFSAFECVAELNADF